MPKATFWNLPEAKRQRILEACKREFETHSVQQASVSNIVKALGIARGSFYQYFESLEECYFSLLMQEDLDIHAAFEGLVRAREGDFFAALQDYRLLLAELLFRPEKRALFRNRFLSWTAELEQEWQAYKKRQAAVQNPRALETQAFARLNLDNLRLNEAAEATELLSFTQAVIHELIRRSLLQDWSREVFLERLARQLEWMQYGLQGG